ncbi:MAG: VWA domain-containing protein [Clostridiales bacterium]|nr:VWA domain-containing protein [Clostridiales bacterium]
MKIDPILPIPVMAVICIILLVLKRKGVWNYIRQIIIVLLLFAINLRILVPTDKVNVVNTNIDVLFVIDNTISMLAEDYNGDDRRIDGVKEDVEYIMGEFEGARYGVATFTTEVNYLVPFTYEQDIATQAIEALDGQAKTTGNGTSLNTGYDALNQVLKPLYKSDDDEDDEEEIDVEEDPRIVVVFFISDGEITDGSKLKSFERVADYIDTGAVLGYGTRTGGKMKVRDIATWDDTSYLTYYDSNFNSVTAVSKIDEGNLEDIAADLGLNYYHMTKPSNARTVAADVMDNIETGQFTKSVEDRKGFAETYWIFAIALGVFLAYDFVVLRTKMGRER